MALQKQALNINFAQGLNTKSDPKQVTPGQFLELKNSVFTKAGLLQKRNGYGMLSALPTTDSTYLTTFNGNLTAIGSRLYAYSSNNNTWVNKGALQPAQLEVLPLIRSNTNQSQADSAVSDNNLVCTVFTDNIPVNGILTEVYKYVIADAITGQNIVAPTVIVPSAGAVAGSSKVFVLGRYFIVLFPVLITATYHIQYIAISRVSPTIVTAAADIAATYSPSASGSFEGAVFNNNLYIAWNGNDGGGAVRVSYLDSTLVQHPTKVIAGKVATLMSVCVDPSDGDVYVTFYDSGSNNGYTAIYDRNLNVVLASTLITAARVLENITCVAQLGVETIYYQVHNTYSYDSAIRTDFINQVTITRAGVVSSTTTLIRSVGLASKAFVLNDVRYFLSIYGSPPGIASNQPSYHLIDQNGKAVARLAYSNGGSYLTRGLPLVTVTDNVAQFAYLIKDQIEAVNKSQDAPSSAGVYSQTGINLASIEIGGKIVSAEIGDNLNLSGGFLWAYDGFEAVEQGFFLWPDSVEATLVADPTPTATTTSGSPTLTAVSSVAGIVVGMAISGTGIAANSVVTAVGTTTITMNNNATANGTVTITFAGAVSAQQYFYQATYEWADNQGNVFRSAPSIPISVTATAGHTSVLINVPTLRITYKITNPVKIVIYRWSVAQQTYYQVTSQTVPLLNSTTIDSVSFTDIHSDASILGNNIIYTTGGVVENTGAPAASTVSLFKSRLFLIDAENPNVLWFSKQVIQNTPVEMSDLFTLYIAPTTGAQGSTGVSKCLAPMDDKNIIFKKDAIYYFTGTGPDNTGANNDFTDAVFITSTVGSENQQSIVMTPNGLMFQSDKGIWLLSRDLSTTYIGAPVESLTQGAIVESAIIVPGTNQVRFILDTGITLMYDYFYNQWGSFTNVPAISSTIFQGLDTYVNSFGQVLQETPGAYLDGSFPVLMSFLTGWLNLAGLQGYERAYFFYLLGTYISPHKLQASIAYDYNPSATQLSVITPDNFVEPWGGEQLWGSNGPWGGPGNVEQWRVFLQQQKCEAFQIRIQEVFDPTYGTIAGAGLTISGLDLVVGIKSGYPRLRSSRSVG